MTLPHFTCKPMGTTIAGLTSCSKVLEHPRAPDSRHQVSAEPLTRIFVHHGEKQLWLTTTHWLTRLPGVIIQAGFNFKQQTAHRKSKCSPAEAPLWAHPLYRPKKSQTALGILEKWTHFLTGGSGLELGVSLCSTGNSCVLSGKFLSLGLFKERQFDHL